MTWLLWAVYKAPLLSSFSMFFTVYGKYALDGNLWSFDHLVESESCAPLIPLVGKLMDSKVISTARSECVVARLLKISKTLGRKCILIRAMLTKANFWYLATALIKACVIEACRAVRNNILSPFFDENKKRFLVKF